MTLLRTCALGALLTLGCRAPSTPTTNVPAFCSDAQRLAHGGSFFRASDGTEIWYRTSGRPGAPVLVFLHGGPGYNSYTFEHSAGPLLEPHYQVLYFDQRGAGRSNGRRAPAAFGMARTVDDLEALRAHLGMDRLVLIGHSFGGLVAAEFAHRHPARVAAVVMVDSTPDMPAALAHQVRFLDQHAADFPDHTAKIHQIAARPEPAIDRLLALYGELGAAPLQRRVHFRSQAAQDAMEQLDRASGVLGCSAGASVQALRDEGYFTEQKATVATRITAPTLLVAGRASQTIGADNVAAAALVWGATLRFLDTGHFVYFEQPAAFAEMVVAWLGERPLH